ncbi:hypothetical protein [Epilithonimonas arachidiradicis]|uniref:Uncharacterized protein n=1 Tax=Epilithonimonas arachidiradicis TaxID=1617282 RepID=A0A420DCK8_9FLAO|nr:hypothetical protein [Epilithonimonas arachidiradicis]RKE89638.1 hypothetical protein BXY58_0208 [Epilithonimonas arachidiradicis]GGG44148.1 hypothetical protein GCM10007332_01960 [Epilithonimonas arachidiradicis]
MKTIVKFLLLIIIIINTSCNFSKNQSDKSSKEQGDNVKSGKPFFDFDAVDYYSNDIDENIAMNLLNLQNNSELDKLKYDLIVGETPENINNNNFTDDIIKVGFKKSEIESKDFQSITQLFSESTERDGLYFTCIPIFRDILVFKKNKRIIGAAKICFGCNRNQIIGTKANTNNFGQGKDYEMLSLILNKYKNIN